MQAWRGARARGATTPGAAEEGHGWVAGVALQCIERLVGSIERPGVARVEHRCVGRVARVVWRSHGRVQARIGAGAHLVVFVVAWCAAVTIAPSPRCVAVPRRREAGLEQSVGRHAGGVVRGQRARPVGAHARLLAWQLHAARRARRAHPRREHRAVRAYGAAEPEGVVGSGAWSVRRTPLDAGDHERARERR